MVGPSVPNNSSSVTSRVTATARPTADLSKDTTARWEPHPTDRDAPGGHRSRTQQVEVLATDLPALVGAFREPDLSADPPWRRARGWAAPTWCPGGSGLRARGHAEQAHRAHLPSRRYSLQTLQADLSWTRSSTPSCGSAAAVGARPGGRDRGRPDRGVAARRPGRHDHPARPTAAVLGHRTRQPVAVAVSRQRWLGRRGPRGARDGGPAQCSASGPSEHTGTANDLIDVVDVGGAAAPRRRLGSSSAQLCLYTTPPDGASVRRGAGLGRQ